MHEKIAFIQQCSQDDEHILIVPGACTEAVENSHSRVYFIHSPLVSRKSQYRALLNLRAVDDILERERPDLIESSDPYQLGWKAISAGRALRIPVTGFYHSHFAEAYLRGVETAIGRRPAELIMSAARRYVRHLYNQFEATLVPSAGLVRVLTNWGVGNVRPVKLGVNTEVFNPAADGADALRESLGIRPGQRLLLYVGRLANEKNTQTLFTAMELLAARAPGAFHLLAIGDGPQRANLEQACANGASITWRQYCADSRELARHYRAADLFVHPGVQETFGLVALESQACGTPVVGIRGSYMDQVILHDQESWATENSPGALAEAIEQSSIRDLDMLGRIAAEKVTDLYSWPRVFEQLFCIYREVCANYRRH